MSKVPHSIIFIIRMAPNGVVIITVEYYFKQNLMLQTENIISILNCHKV